MPNREQRRKQPKGDKNLILKSITLQFEGQEPVMLDIHKVLIVDKITKKPLFNEKKEQNHAK